MPETRVVLDWLHLLALAVGLGGLWSRARALHDSLRNAGDSRALHRAYVGDAWWSTAVVLWLITGIWRLVSGTENVVGYYSTELGFFLKMALFVAVVALEVWPATTVVRWRLGRAEPNVRDAGRIEAISYVQCALVVGIVFAVAAMGTAKPDASSPSAIRNFRAASAAMHAMWPFVRQIGSSEWPLAKRPKPHYRAAKKIFNGTKLREYESESDRLFVCPPET